MKNDTFSLSAGFGEGQLLDQLLPNLLSTALTDDSILSSDLRAHGFHTMTLFGSDTPWRLFAQNMRRCAGAQNNNSSQNLKPGC